VVESGLQDHDVAAAGDLAADAVRGAGVTGGGPVRAASLRRLQSRRPCMQVHVTAGMCPR